jgi:hypothetical protein
MRDVAYFLERMVSCIFLPSLHIFIFPFTLAHTFHTGSRRPKNSIQVTSIKQYLSVQLAVGCISVFNGGIVTWAFNTTGILWFLMMWVGTLLRPLAQLQLRVCCIAQFQQIETLAPFSFSGNYRCQWSLSCQKHQGVGFSGLRCEQNVLICCISLALAVRRRFRSS